jgi:starch phosphorylase
MWQFLWPEEKKKCSIGYVTNVCIPHLAGSPYGLLFEKYLSPDWVDRLERSDLWKHITQIPDEELWAVPVI